MSAPAKTQVTALTLATLKDLYAEGLVDMNQLKTSAFLTPEGYAAADGEGVRDQVDT